MKNKMMVILLLLVCSVSIYSQNYYWYNNEKIKIDVDSTRINVTTILNIDLRLFLQQLDGIRNVQQLEQAENSSLLFSVDLVSAEKYIDIVSYFHSLKEVVSIFPYFKRSENNPIGTSSFFYVKLHKEDDYELLSKFAIQNDIEVVKQVPYMPTWYIMSTMNTKLNAVEASNLAYESGSFAEVDPAFMFNFSANCTNDPDFNLIMGIKKYVLF